MVNKRFQKSFHKQ